MTLLERVEHKEFEVKKSLFATVTSVAVVASLIAAAPVAAADRRSIPRVAAGVSNDLATGLFSPLSLVTDGGGVSYVAQNFAGVLTRVTKGGFRSDIATAPPGWELGALSLRGDTIYYVQGVQPEGKATLMALPKSGGPAVPLADLGAYEASANPDQVQTYGFTDLPGSCLDQIDPTTSLAPPSYSGVVDTHPYASIALKGAIYVADAGGNDILRVGYDGTVSTLAVLPPSAPVKVTAELAAEAGFPDCTIGYDYSFEAVPTDIEVGPDGWLYVSTLPGGPENASAGLRGSVYKINTATKQVRLVATGLTGATGLAVSSTLGVIFVAELYGGPRGAGQVSVILPNTGQPIGAIPVVSPASIELRGGTIYATRYAFVPDSSGAPQPIGRLTAVPLVGGKAVWGSSAG